LIPNLKRFGKYWLILALTKEFLYLLYTFVFDVAIKIEHIRWVIGISFIATCLWYGIWYSEHSDDENEKKKTKL